MQTKSLIVRNGSGDKTFNKKQAIDMDISGQTVNVVVANDAAYFEKIFKIKSGGSHIDYNRFNDWIMKTVVPQSPFISADKKEISHVLKNVLWVNGAPPYAEEGTPEYKRKGDFNKKITYLGSLPNWTVFTKLVRENYIGDDAGLLNPFYLRELEEAYQTKDWQKVKHICDRLSVRRIKYSQKSCDTRIVSYIESVASFTHYNKGKTLVVLIGSDTDFADVTAEGILKCEGNLGVSVVHFEGLVSNELINNFLVKKSKWENYLKPIILDEKNTEELRYRNPNRIDANM